MPITSDSPNPMVLYALSFMSLFLAIINYILFKRIDWIFLIMGSLGTGAILILNIYERFFFKPKPLTKLEEREFQDLFTFMRYRDFELGIKELEEDVI